MDNKVTLRYIGYTRKSSDDNKERQAASLPEQMYVLEGIKVKHNLNVIEILSASESAFTKGRKIFNSLLERIEKGEVNAILVWHENRLARNAFDAGQIIDLMDKEKIVEIRTPGRIYHNTPGDKFMLQIELASSKKDSDDKSIVVKRGLEKKLRDGWRPGVAPQGYLNDKGTESGFRRILTDPLRMPYIKKIFEMFYEGTPVVDIHEIAKNEWHYLTPQKKRIGGKPLTTGMIYWILTNPFYCGKYEYPIGSGQWHEGKHERAVSSEIYEAIQVKLGRKSPYKLKNHEFAFSALMRCAICASGIVSEEKWQCICSNCKLKFSLSRNNKDTCTGCETKIAAMQNPTILHYIYYRCGKKKNRFCLEKSVRVDRLEEQVIKILERLAIPECFLEWAVEQIYKMGENEQSFEKETVDNTERAYKACKQKLQNLLQLKISPANSDGSLISDDEYKTQKQTLESELKAIEAQLGGGAEKAEEADQKTIKAISFAIRAKQRFEERIPKVQRDIFMGLGSHPILQQRTVIFDSPKYLFALEKMKKEIDEEIKRIAPNNQIDLASQMPALCSSIPTVLRGRELNPTCKIMHLLLQLPRVSDYIFSSPGW